MRELIAAAHGARFLQLVLLALSTWAVIYGRFTLGPLQETLRVDLGLSDTQVALLLGPGVAVPMALSAIPLGLLIDRYSRARALLLFAVINLVAVLLTAFAPGFGALFVGRALTGLALAAVLIAAYAMVGDLYPEHQRGRATMLVAAGEISGAPAAFALGGMLLGAADASIGFDLGLDGWRGVLLVLCVPLLPIVLLMFLLREPRRVAGALDNGALRRIRQELWRHRSVVMPLMFARVMVWIADGAVLVWAAPAFSRRFDLPADEVGVIIASVLLVGGVLGPLIGGVVADLCQRAGGSRRTMLGMGIVALLSAPAGLFALMPDATLAALLLAAFMTLGYAVNVMAMTQVTIVVPTKLRGLFVAISLAGSALFCFGLAPVVVSVLSAAIGGPARIGESLAIVCAVLSVVGAAIFILGRRHFSREASAP